MNNHQKLLFLSLLSLTSLSLIAMEEGYHSPSKNEEDEMIYSPSVKREHESESEDSNPVPLKKQKVAHSKSEADPQLSDRKKRKAERTRELLEELFQESSSDEASNTKKEITSSMPTSAIPAWFMKNLGNTPFRVPNDYAGYVANFFLKKVRLAYPMLDFTNDLADFDATADPNNQPLYKDFRNLFDAAIARRQWDFVLACLENPNFTLDHSYDDEVPDSQVNYIQHTIRTASPTCTDEELPKILLIISKLIEKGEPINWDDNVDPFPDNNLICWLITSTDPLARKCMLPLLRFLISKGCLDHPVNSCYILTLCQLASIDNPDIFDLLLGHHSKERIQELLNIPHGRTTAADQAFLLGNTKTLSYIRQHGGKLTGQTSPFEDIPMDSAYEFWRRRILPKAFLQFWSPQQRLAANSSISFADLLHLLAYNYFFQHSSLKIDPKLLRTIELSTRLYLRNSDKDAQTIFKDVWDELRTRFLQLFRHETYHVPRKTDLDGKQITDTHYDAPSQQFIKTPREGKNLSTNIAHVLRQREHGISRSSLRERIQWSAQTTSIQGKETHE